MADILTEALRYAGQGLHVFPVKADKTPATAHGFKDASNHPMTVERMFKTAKDVAGIGWVPGPSGYVVVDVDVKGGATGEADLQDLKDKYGDFTEGAAQVLTPSGGQHYIFKKNGKHIDNRSLAGSIDIRADNGYGILPPTPGYEWELTSQNLAGAATQPSWIEEEQGRHRSEVRETMLGDTTAKIPEGSRQETLFAAGMAMRARGFSENAIDAALRDMNEIRCEPRMSDKRMVELLAGVMRANMDADPNAITLTRIRHNEGGPLDWEQVWQTEYPPVSWVPGMEGIAITGRATNMYGPAGTGKSELVLHRAVRAAQSGARVLWLDREMVESDVRQRLQDMGFSPSDLKNLTYIMYPDLPLLDTAEGGDALLAVSDLHDAEVVIIDSLSKFVRDEEGETHTMFYVHAMLPMRMAGHAFVMIDHTGKDISRKARGASQKVDNVDYYTEITRVNNVGPMLTTKKQRHSWVEKTYQYRRSTDPVLSYKMSRPACVFCREPATGRSGLKQEWTCDGCRP